MRFARSIAIAFVTVTAACSDSTSPPAARSPQFATVSASTFPVAHATVRVLSGLDGNTPVAINDSDEVVGNTGTGLPFSGSPFKWTPKAGIKLLSLGDNRGAVTAAVNDNGAIAGTGVDTVIAATRAIVWLPNGSVRDLRLGFDSLNGVDAANGCSVTGMNIYAQLVGTCVAHGAFHFGTWFFWHNSDTLYNNAPQDGNQFSSISDDGWIGGAVNLEFNIDGPFILSPAHQQILLKGHDGLVHTGSAVNAVTHHGWAAGYSSEGGCTQAVAWLAHPGQSYPEFRMGVCGQSNGITDDWYVVGTASDSAMDASANRAFVWFPAVGTQRLPGLGGTGETSTAVAVNAKHHVLGTITSGGTTHVVIWNVGP